MPIQEFQATYQHLFFGCVHMALITESNMWHVEFWELSFRVKDQLEQKRNRRT